MDLSEPSSSGSIVEVLPEITEASTTSQNTDANEQVSPEYLQRKLYFLLEHLKKMHSELPE